MAKNPKPRNKVEAPHQFDAARYAEQLHAGDASQGTFSWYLERARFGDHEAAARVLSLCSKSLSEEALVQNQGHIDPIVAQFLCAELAAVLGGSNSALTALVSTGKQGRRRSVDLGNIKFWFTVKVVERMNAGQTRETAIADELENWPALKGEDNAVMAYKKWKHPARAHLAQVRAAGEEVALDATNPRRQSVLQRLAKRAERQGRK